MRKVLRLLMLALFFGAAAAALVIWGAYRASQQRPEFYVAALQRDPIQQQVAGDDLERAVLELRNDIQHEGGWQAIFTDEQINGWLAADMPEKFPQLLPNGAADPRVAIQPERAMLACRYESERISTVVSLALEIQLTDEPNVLAVRVLRARAGALPLPLTQFLDRVSFAARRADIGLRWAQTDGDPVALVEIPSEHTELDGRRFIIESIELDQGELALAGRTIEEDEETTGDPVQLSARRPPPADQSAE